MDEQLSSRVREIKQSFRLLMNGAASQSMRDKGLNYHVNWGASYQMLQETANEIGQDYDLAIALWKENVRECKILATMLMPAEKMPKEIVDIWMEQTPTQEIAEQAAFNLYQHLPFAAEKAYQWIADDKQLKQICGYHILSRLFMSGKEPNDRGINEFLDQAQTALQQPSLPVRKAAFSAIRHFASLGIMYERLSKSCLKQINLDFF